MTDRLWLQDETREIFPLSTILTVYRDISGPLGCTLSVAFTEKGNLFDMFQKDLKMALLSKFDCNFR